MVTETTLSDHLSETRMGGGWADIEATPDDGIDSKLKLLSSPGLQSLGRHRVGRAEEGNAVGGLPTGLSSDVLPERTTAHHESPPRQAEA